MAMHFQVGLCAKISKKSVKFSFGAIYKKTKANKLMFLEKLDQFLTTESRPFVLSGNFKTEIKGSNFRIT